MFMAFAMQPLLAQVSYYAGGADGHAFAFYRTECGEARALFTDSQKRWCTQAVDPATGRLVGSAAAAATDGFFVPNSTTTPAAAPPVEGKNNASPPPAASLWEGWARPGVRMLFFSAPVGGGDAGVGVVSAAVSVHDVFEAAGNRIGVQDGLDVYYAVGDDKDDDVTSASANYEPLLLGYQHRTADDTVEDTLTFSELKCAASAIDDAAPELGQVVSGGPKHNRYKAACAMLDVSGVQVVRTCATKGVVYTTRTYVMRGKNILHVCVCYFWKLMTWQVVYHAARNPSERSSDITLILNSIDRVFFLS